MEPQTKKVSIVVPCYNEERTIYEILRRALQVDLNIPGLQREIIIVDDGSTDDSWEQIQSFAADNPDAPLITVRHDTNRGKGRAIRTALDRADGDYLIVQDADLEYYAEDYPDLLKPLVDGAPVVYGNRRQGRLWRRHISGLVYAMGGLFQNLFYKMLFWHGPKITDIATCYKCFHMDVIRELPLQCEGFEFCTEVSALLANRNIPIKEIPIRYQPRKKWQGKKITSRDFFIGLYTLLKNRIKKR